MSCGVVDLLRRTDELLDCSVQARSITYAGIMEIVKLMAPSDLEAGFVSKDMQRMFMGIKPFNGVKEKFHPMCKFGEFYSMRPPDFAVTYVWGMDFRKQLPLYIKSVQDYVNQSEFKHHGTARRFEEMTFWVDIFFVDQNPPGDLSGLIARLVEDCSHVYAQAPHHLIFMSTKVLEKSWCLMEICYRTFAVQCEFTLSIIDLTNLLSGSVNSMMTHSSTVTLRPDVTETFIHRNKLPSLHFIDDITAEISKYAADKSDIKRNMTAFDPRDLDLIGEIVTILFRDEATFNRVIRAFAKGAMHQLKKKYGPPTDL